MGRRRRFGAIDARAIVLEVGETRDREGGRRDARGVRKDGLDSIEATVRRAMGGRARARCVGLTSTS
jgi:hypothetical protein